MMHCRPENEPFGGRYDENARKWGEMEGPKMVDLRAKIIGVQTVLSPVLYIYKVTSFSATCYLVLLNFIVSLPCPYPPNLYHLPPILPVPHAYCSLTPPN